MKQRVFTLPPPLCENPSADHANSVHSAGLTQTPALESTETPEDGKSPSLHREVCSGGAAAGDMVPRFLDDSQRAGLRAGKNEEKYSRGFQQASSKAQSRRPVPGWANPTFSAARGTASWIGL